MTWWGKGSGSRTRHGFGLAARGERGEERGAGKAKPEGACGFALLRSLAQRTCAH